MSQAEARHITTDLIKSIVENPESLATVEMKHVPGVMDKLLLVVTDDYEIWCNVFENSNETYIHDHKSDFYSTMLEGSYVYKIWNVQAGSGTHVEVKRESGNVLGKAETCDGSLYVQHTGKHFAGNTVFVPNTEFHTVEADKTCSKCVTLVVRDRAKKAGCTRILTEESDVDSDSQDVPTTGVPAEVAAKVLEACKSYARST